MGDLIVGIGFLVGLWLLARRRRAQEERRSARTLGGLVPETTRYTCSSCGSLFSAVDLSVGHELRSLLVCACCAAEHEQLAREMGKPRPPKPFGRSASYDPEGQRINSERPDLSALAKSLLRSPENQNDLAKDSIARRVTPEQFANLMGGLMDGALCPPESESVAHTHGPGDRPACVATEEPPHCTTSQTEERQRNYSFTAVSPSGISHRLATFFRSDPGPAMAATSKIDFIAQTVLRPFMDTTEEFVGCFVAWWTPETREEDATQWLWSLKLLTSTNPEELVRLECLITDMGKAHIAVGAFTPAAAHPSKPAAPRSESIIYNQGKADFIRQWAWESFVSKAIDSDSECAVLAMLASSPELAQGKIREAAEILAKSKRS